MMVAPNEFGCCTWMTCVIMCLTTSLRCADAVEKKAERASVELMVTLQPGMPLRAPVVGS